jgi:hypothetical protein
LSNTVRSLASWGPFALNILAGRDPKYERNTPLRIQRPGCAKSQIPKRTYQKLALQTDGFRMPTVLREHLRQKFSSNTDIAKGALCPKKLIRSIRSYTVP